MRAFLATGPVVHLEQLVQLRHPAASLDALLPPTQSLSVLRGDLRSSLRGRGMDFDEVRPYRPGDDIRSIDWRVTARTARAHTKVFREEKDRPLLLAVDQSRSLFFGSRITYKSVMAAQVAALFAWNALAHNDRVGGLVFNDSTHDEIRPARQRRSVLRLLDKIVDYNRRLETDTAAAALTTSGGLNRALAALERLARPGTAIVIASDFRDFDADSERLLHRLARHCSLVAVQIADSLEQTLPAAGRLSVTDGVSRLGLDTGDRQLAARYTDAFDARLQQRNRCFAPLGIAHPLVWTHDDPAVVLMQQLRRRAA